MESPDGAHIVTLWLTFFFRFYRELIENGYIFISCAPLFKITKGKREEYAYTDAHKDKLIEELGGFDRIQRYKGLGEMNEEQLWDTTMNPETRKLIQVTLEDLENDEEMLIVCMGEDVAPRREFIINKSSFELSDVTVEDENELAFVEEM